MHLNRITEGQASEQKHVHRKYLRALRGHALFCAVRLCMDLALWEHQQSEADLVRFAIDHGLLYNGAGAELCHCAGAGK